MSPKSREEVRGLSACSGLVALLLLASPSSGQVVFRPAILSASPISGDLQAEPVLGDLDGDGLPDMVRRQVFGSAVLLNLGGGLFGPPTNVASVQFPTLVDMNGDGHADLVGIDVALSGMPPTLRVLPGLGDGTFGALLETELAVANPTQMSVLDLDHDGLLDVVVQSGVPIFTGHSLEVYRGRGDGTFDAGESVFTIPTTFSLEHVVGDVDGDGRLELVLVSIVGGAAGGLYWIVDGALGEDFTLTEDRLPLFVGSADGADLNGDGVLDMLCLAGGHYVTLMGNGDGTFAHPVLAIDHAVVVRDLGGDFDGDGRVDLLTRPAAGEVRVWLGDGDGGFTAVTTFGGDVDYGYPGVGDIDADGRDDVVVIGTDPVLGLDIAASSLNATYAEASPFEDLGGALPLPGSGYPIQIAYGRLLPRTPYRFEAFELPEGSLAWLVLGAETQPATRGGNALVPASDLVLGPFVVGVDGALDLHGVWPTALPSGLLFYSQFVIEDGGGAVGRTSLVRAVTP